MKVFMVYFRGEGRGESKGLLTNANIPLFGVVSWNPLGDSPKGVNSYERKLENVFIHQGSSEFDMQ
jgi:hypothetical protein